MTEGAKHALIIALGLVTIFGLALGWGWWMLLVAAYCAVWGGEALVAWRFWRMRRRAAKSPPLDEWV
jgi:Flp pilus assembly protein TadB